MDNDMSNLMAKVNDMLKNDNMPNEFRELVKNLSNSNSSNGFNEQSSNNPPISDSGFDIATLMKLKSVMDKMNSKQDNHSSNLLTSLKPYLSSKKKDKIDQYVKFLNMSKMMSALNLFGGDKDK